MNILFNDIAIFERLNIRLTENVIILWREIVQWQTCARFKTWGLYFQNE